MIVLKDMNMTREAFASIDVSATPNDETVQKYEKALPDLLNT
jgi:hypothetical protein